MPLYEYVAEKDGCDHCNQPFEVYQSFNDDPVTKCPKCKKPVRRAFSVPAAPKKSLAGQLSSETQSQIDQLAASGRGSIEKSKDGKKIKWTAPPDNS